MIVVALVISGGMILVGLGFIVWGLLEKPEEVGDLPISGWMMKEKGED